MKRISRTFVIMLLVMMMSPLTAFAVPGFLEVNLTPKNFTKYFEVTKMKQYMEFGEYGGYWFIFKSKLLNKGYYLYSDEDFAVKYTATIRTKYNVKETRKANLSQSSISLPLATFGSNCDYKYGKLSNFKVKKIKGKLVFIEPSNVVSIQDYYGSDGDYRGKKIILKQPYDEKTDYEYHFDDNHNKVIDYYYYNAFIAGSNFNNNGKNYLVFR